MKYRIALVLIIIAVTLGFWRYQRYIVVQHGMLEKEIRKLEIENKRLLYVNSLADEFGYNPVVVEVVDHYARKIYKPDDTRYRMISSPEALTYLMLSLIQIESAGDPQAQGDSGKAYGLTQIWLSTARDYEAEVQGPQLLAIDKNIEISLKHFDALLGKYAGNPYTALVSWNRGMGSVDKWLLEGVSPANGYEAKVLTAALNSNRKSVLGAD